MTPYGEAELLTAARSALLDALEALAAHGSSIIVVGAQAIYLHTGAAAVALAEMTKDSDLAIDRRALGSQPLIEQSMEAAGFRRSTVSPQPGTWLNRHGVPVDLLVPESLAGPTGRRGARIPPHAKHAARRTVGIEATLVDNAPLTIRALTTADDRVFVANVAGPASLLVAKCHKLYERRTTSDRLVDKDAHDVYRLLAALSTESLARPLARLMSDPFSGPTTHDALRYFDELFATGATAVGSAMAGRAERLVGSPAFVSNACALLAVDLLAAVAGARPG